MFYYARLKFSQEKRHVSRKNAMQTKGKKLKKEIIELLRQIILKEQLNRLPNSYASVGIKRMK